MSRAGLAASITMILASTAGLASAATTTGSPSFASRADGACAAAGAKVVALPAPTPLTVVPDLKSTRAIVVKLVAQLKSIKAPAKQAKAYKAFIASTAEQGTILGETLTAFDANDTSKIERLGDDEQTVGKRSDSQAKALKLPACAKDYNPSAMPSTGTPTTPTTEGSSTAASTIAPPATPTPAATSTPAAASTTSSGSGGASDATGSSSSSSNSSQSANQSSSGSSSGGQTVTGVFSSTP